MKLNIYQVDAFTTKVFGGNPAAVIPLEQWLDEYLMQKIALENNLSETAFFVKENDEYRIRWFTPTAEVDLCGHATLAAGFVLFNNLGYNSTTIKFNSKSGLLNVSNKDGVITLDFPARNPEKITPDPILLEALPVTPDEVLFDKTIIAVFKNEEIVRNMKPDIKKFLKVNTHGVIITAPGKNVDFVSRFFAPDVGIDEDPVTGYAHTLLVPYWVKRLGINNLTAKQVSKREGDLFCKKNNDRIFISGNGVLYMKGEINI